MLVYQQYAAHLLRHGTLLESTADAVEPGMVLTSLEGIDWGDQAGVVLDVSEETGERVLTVYLTDTKQTKQYRVPDDSAFQSRTPEEQPDEPTTTVYDPLRMNEQIVYGVANSGMRPRL